MKHLKRYSQLFESTQELTQEQKDWLDKCTKGTWSVNPQTGLVDIDGSFDCIRQGLTDFKGVRFGQVSGYFYCSHNELKSLEGAPQRVDLTFDCDRNMLASLKGAPQSVGGGFYCSHNGLKSLEGLPDGFMVGNDFNCSYNELKSLEGLPDVFKAGGSFNCSFNELTSLEGLPAGFKVGRIFYCHHNNLKSLEGAPDGFMAGNDFNCSYNELRSLKGLPDGFKVGVGFYCYNNPISERAIRGVVKRMGDKKISLEQAVAEYWKWIPQEDGVYLAKHHPTLPEEEKKVYRAIELNMKRR